MWGIRSAKLAEMEAKLAALDKSQAVIEFAMDGTVLAANERFFQFTGYAPEEVVGRHHSMFLAPGEKETPEYARFWERLRAGRFDAAQYRRIVKGGREVWIEASYNPILGPDGRPVKVIKYATDITERKAEQADLKGQVDAIRRSQAVISFDLDGTIVDANENFLKAVGYGLDEIRGRHHSMFVEPAERDGRDYAEFWAKLKAGGYHSGQFRRVGKGGREVWIEATYNPVLDAAGRPYKVVKFAADVTRQVQLLQNLNRMIETNFGEIDQAILRSNREAGEATRAADETSTNVQMMASAAEELAASVDEISSSMAKSRAATDSAFDQARKAGDLTHRLSQAATAMGGIVGLIQTIAGQINLLALNATIESARAGEAGRGFAVVASEVKNLASQAARATEQIAREIDGVQSISGDVVGALGAISESMGVMRDHVMSTATAIEQQSAVTRDMSHNMQSAAHAVSTISHGIGEISQAVAQVSGTVGRTKEAARVLAR
jgi:methyl-accepting chemotaxis protein